MTWRIKPNPGTAGRPFSAKTRAEAIAIVRKLLGAVEAADFAAAIKRRRKFSGILGGPDMAVRVSYPH